MADQQKAKQTETRVVETAGGDVRITQPKGKRHNGVHILLEPDELVREQVGGFTNFLREYGVVALAVGFIIGQQANTVMKQLVNSFVQPWLQVVFGENLNSRHFTVHHGNAPIEVQWGAFVYTFIEFFFVAVIIYAVVKFFQLDKLKKQKGKK